MSRLFVLAFVLSSALGCRESENQQVHRDAFRMTATDVFDIRGRSPVVMGRVNVGRIAVGNKAIVLLGEDSVPVTIRAIEKFRQTGLKEVSSGADDVALELDGVSVVRLREGFASGPLTLVSPP